MPATDNAAYYDFFRKIVLQPDNVTLEADSTTDTLTITGGNGVSLNPNASTDSFNINVDYQLYVPIGTTNIRLQDVNSNFTGVALTAGSNIAITRTSNNEMTITATVGAASKSIQSVSQTNPAIVTTTNDHEFTEGTAVTITDVVGMTELNGNEYFMDILTGNTFALYEDELFVTPLDATGFTPYSTGGVATADYSSVKTLSGLSDVDTTSAQPNDLLSYQFGTWTPTKNIMADVSGSIFGDDSTVLVDAVNNIHYGTFIGDVTGNLTGNVTGDVTGNLTGNVTGDVTGDVTGNIFTSLIDSTDSSAITFTPNVILSAGLTVGNHILPSSSLNIDLGSENFRFRDLYLSGNSAIIGDLALKRHTTGGLIVSDHSTGNPTNITTHNIAANDVTAVGTITAALIDATDVQTSGIVTFNNNVNAIAGINGDLTGSVFGDDSTLLIDGTNNVIPKANIQDSVNWDAAFSWGDHSAAGYQSASASFTGDIKGSVFGDDSTVLVDAINGFINLTNNDTDTLSEGTVNLYYTDARAQSATTGRSIAMSLIFGG
jgi:hypothetical protein